MLPRARLAGAASRVGEGDEECGQTPFYFYFYFNKAML
jgi:hypothetical protein